MARPKKQFHEMHTERINFRVTPAEQAALAAKADKAGLSLSEFVRRMVLQGKIEINNGTSDMGMALIALNRIGSNINQIARQANGGAGVNPAALYAALDAFHAVCEDIRNGATRS